jgi:orotidine-5'-phosphate decarboxylase
VVRRIRQAGCEVFLDLKFHDIPNTVAGAVRSAALMGASMVTVHAAGGAQMLEAAAAAARAAGEPLRVMGVTVLTSMSVTALRSAWGREGAVELHTEVLRLAGLCRDAGLHGVVCSGHESRQVVAVYGEALAPLVPGIRFAGGEAHDQSRVVTPRMAAEAGARYVVLGRAVTGALDPAAAMTRVHEELEAGGVRS